MSAIIKFHTRKNKNSLLQHSSCSVQTQDYQISLKTRNIFCVALKDCLTDATAHGLGEGAAPSAESWKGSAGAGLPTPPSWTQHWFLHTLLRPAATKHSKVWTWFIQENGAAPPWRSLRLLPGAWPAEHGSLYWCYWEKHYKVSIISAELIEMPILRFFSHKYFWQCSTPQIFSSLLMSRTYCTAAKHPQSRAKKSALNFSGENASIQASWELPGFVSSPVRTLPRQWLKSAWSYVWIIKCPFSELEDRNFPQLWGIQVSIQQVSFKLVCFFSPLSHTIIKMKEVNADSLIFLWTGNVWSSIFIIQLLLAEIFAVNFKFIGIFSLYTCTSQLLTMLLWAVCNHLDNKALWEACDPTEILQFHIDRGSAEVTTEDLENYWNTKGKSIEKEQWK